MMIYQPGQNGDAELLAWYLRLCDEGDLTRLYGHLGQPLSDFIKNYTDPMAMLAYEADDQGWWIVGWIKPFMGGASWGLWIRPDKRRTASAVSFALKLHELGFEHFPCLMLATTQDEVVASMKRMGYTYLGIVPSLFGGDEGGHVMYLTRKDFAGTLALWKDRSHGRSSR